MKGQGTLYWWFWILKKQLKKEVTDFIDDIEEDRIKAEDLYDDLSKEEDIGEECVRSPTIFSFN